MVKVKPKLFPLKGLLERIKHAKAYEKFLNYHIKKELEEE